MKVHTKAPYRLILIEDGTTKDDKGRIKIQHLLSDEEWSWKLCFENHGVAWAFNEIVAKSTASYLCIMNSDVWCFPDWDEPLIKILETEENAATAGPCTNYAANWQRVFSLGMSLPDAERQWPAKSEELIQENGGKTYKKLTQTIGFCFIMKKETYEKVGWFDERFCPAFFEETDFCYRANDLGLSNYWALDSYVHHFGSRTVGDKGSAETRRLMWVNDRKFQKKRLGIIKGEICHLEK